MSVWHRLTAILESPAMRRGQGLVEYALILVFVAVVLIALLTILGPGLREVYQNILNVL